jgi:hypothetical protein
MWACEACNAAKLDSWPTDEQAANGRRWVDPTAEPLGDHLRLDGDCVIALSETGKWIIGRLRLDRGVHEERRRTRRRNDLRLAQLRLAILGIDHDPALRELLLREAHALGRELSGPPWDPVEDCRCRIATRDKRTR